MGLLAEFKRRNVFKVGAAYLVVGWLVVEIASVALPAFEAPGWVLRVFILVVMLGFPIALVIAWIFDMTPHGVQVTQGGTGNKRFYATVAIIAAAALGWFFYSGSPEQTTETMTDSSVVEATVDERPSIAVLAFDDLSQDGDQAYFARGISEELLNILAGVGGLKVASRTSAFSFAGTNTPLPEIARQLDVAHVLEGSVRKQGTRVRITAQLIDAATDAHLWSQTYDRELTDIFAVQEEIAQAITAALQVVLGTQQVRVEAPTDNLEAYQLFLRGRTRFHQRSELDPATEDLRTAVTLDPEFAQAWTYLGAVTWVMVGGNYFTNQDWEVLRATSREAVDRALALDPDIPLALALRAQQYLEESGADNLATGMSLLERAASRQTEDSTPRMWLGMHYSRLGYIDRAAVMFQQALDQDPLLPINHGYYGWALYQLGREDVGMLHARRALEMSGGALPWWVASIARDLLARGEQQRAEAYLLAATEGFMQDPSSAGHALAVEVRESVIPAISDRALLEEQLARIQAGSATAGVYLLAIMHTREEIFLDAIATSNDFFIRQLPGVAWSPSLNLRERPEFFGEMERIGIAAYWAANGYPRGCRLVESPAGNHLDCSERR